MLKKLLFLSFAAFLAWQSFGLIRGLNHLENDSWGTLLFVAWLVNLFITGVFAFPSFAYQRFYRILPDSYYRIKRGATLSRSYNLLGIHAFRRLLMFFFWGQERNRKRFFDGTRSGLRSMAEQSKNAECGHFLPFVVILCFCIYMVLLRHWMLGAFTLLINVIGNGYPVLLQRHHRMRIERIETRAL